MWRGFVTYFSIEHTAIPECSFGFALGAFQRGIEIGMTVDAPHPFTPAAGHRLYQHRIADLIRFLLEEFWLLHLPVIAGDHGTPAFSISALARSFRPMARIA